MGHNGLQSKQTGRRGFCLCGCSPTREMPSILFPLGLICGGNTEKYVTAWWIEMLGLQLDASGPLNCFFSKNYTKIPRLGPFNISKHVKSPKPSSQLITWHYVTVTLQFLLLVRCASLFCNFLKTHQVCMFLGSLLHELGIKLSLKFPTLNISHTNTHPVLIV